MSVISRDAHTIRCVYVYGRGVGVVTVRHMCTCHV